MLKDMGFIQDLVNKIEDNLSDEVDIVSLADSFGFSPWHFQRLFKSYVGDTLGGYIRGRRLSKSAQLLLGTELGIIDVAFSVGFNSHEAFTRSFKSYFNLSPKTFRNNKASVLLNEKPLLTMDLMQHLEKEITREPVITVRKEHTIVGFDTTVPSPFFSNEGYCDLLYSSWMKLFEKEAAIKNRIPKTYYGLSLSESGDFIEDTVDYIAGVPITDNSEIPSGMVTHVFPEQLVAMFEVATVDKETVSRTMDYIYGYWLPNSSYTRGHGNDYELFEDVISFENSDLVSNYVIPVIPNKSN